MNDADLCFTLLSASLLFVVLYLFLWAYKQGTWSHYSIKNLPKTFVKPTAIAFFAKASCLIASWALITIAIVQPELEEEQTKLLPQKEKAYEHVDDVVFLLDLSASMRAQDTATGVSRLSRAKEIISQIVENMGGINISLIGYSGDFDLLVPPTEDYLYFRILLDSARINEPKVMGTNFLSLMDGVQTMLGRSAFSKSMLFVLLSDGEDTTFLSLSSQDQEKAKNEVLAKISDTVSKRCRWDVIGVGSSDGAVIPDLLENGHPVTSSMQKPFLEAMAKAGHGTFYEEKTAGLLAIVDNIIADIPHQKPVNAKRGGKHPSIPIVASMAFLLAALFLPSGRRVS